MLRVKLLGPGAKLPTVAHPGSDLGFDIFALEDTVLPLGVAVAVSTGIAAVYRPNFSERKFGLLVKDRSSMAAKGIKTSAGVIDAGYTGELKVMMTNHNKDNNYRDDSNWLCRGDYIIKAGDKIAQLVPTEVFTAGTIVEVDDLGQTARGAGGFGSTGS
jgi:dUTP pyrophosphatase